jgi:hypothetical protein
MTADGIMPGQSHALATTRPSIALCAGFFFAARVMLVLVTVRLFGMDAETGVVISLALNYLLVAAALSSMEMKKTGGGLTSLPAIRAVALYLMISGASLAWTVAASTSAAAAFWLAMVCDTAIVFLQVREYSADDVTEAIFSGFVRGAAVVAAIAWVLPAQSDMRLGDEELLGPNQIGWPCALGFFFAQYLIRRRVQGPWTAYLILLGLTLLRSLSKTTIVAFLVAQVYLLLVNSTMPRRAKMRVLACAVIVMLAFAPLLISYFGTYAESTSAESLTGRVGIWTYMLAEAVERPWIGHGFHSVWKVIPPFYSSGFQARHAHNEFIQQFYAYGVLGIVLVSAIYVTIIRTIRSLLDVQVKQIFVGLFLLTLVRGLADTEAFDLSWPMWLLVLLGALQLQDMKEREVIPCVS